MLNASGRQYANCPDWTRRQYVLVWKHPALWHSVNTWYTTSVWNMGKSREERSPGLSLSVLICISEKSRAAPSLAPPLFWAAVDLILSFHHRQCQRWLLFKGVPKRNRLIPMGGGDSHRMKTRGLPSWEFRNAWMEFRWRACVDELPRHSGWRKQLDQRHTERSMACLWDSQGSATQPRGWGQHLRILPCETQP